MELSYFIEDTNLRMLLVVTQNRSLALAEELLYKTNIKFMARC